jgi:hypothetical protein
MWDRENPKPKAEPRRRAVVEALVKESNPKDVVAWFCVNCGTVYSDKGGYGKYDAERCTVKNHPSWNQDVTPCSEWACEDCGEKCAPYQWYCSKCIGKRRTDQMEKKLAMAEVVQNYPNDQGVFWRDRYFCCISDLIEHCEYEGIEVPKRVWATVPKPFLLDAAKILEDAFESWMEGCVDDVDYNFCGKEKFEAAVEEFNESNSDKVMYFETNKAVDLTDYK